MGNRMLRWDPDTSVRGTTARSLHKDRRTRFVLRYGTADRVGQRMGTYTARVAAAGSRRDLQ